MEHVAAALAAAQAAASKDVTAAAISLLESPPADLWARAARAVARAADKAGAQLEAAVEGYGLEPAELADARAQVAAAARAQLLVHAREAAHTALSRVKDRCARARLPGLAAAGRGRLLPDPPHHIPRM